MIDKKNAEVSIAVAEVEPSPHAGMGATIVADGTTFRVWAPHADNVWVIGSFNDWSRTAHPLAQEEHGIWSAHLPGVKAGDFYKYVIKNGSHIFEKIDPYARMIDRSEQRAVVYDTRAFDWGDEAFRFPPLNEIVFYEMHVGTFNESGGDAPGTFQRAAEKLDYLTGLGVNCILMMPVMEFPGKWSWGYDLSYPFAIERTYGGPDSLKCFIKEAHRRGISFILDVVYNHFGPSGLDMWRFDGWGIGETGGIYFYDDEEKAKTPWGHTRPDYTKPEVRQFIRDNLVMWLDEFHVDGFRWDGTVFIRRQGFLKDAEEIPEGWDLIREMNGFVRSNWPEKLLIAEDLQGEELITTPISDGGAGFDSQWDAAFDYRLREAVTAPSDEERDIEAVWRVVAKGGRGEMKRRVIYTESHDAVSGQENRFRVPFEINRVNPESWESRKLSTLAAGLVFTAPGIPMLFQGQEFLEDERFDSDKPIHWEKRERWKGITRLYQNLIALRRNIDGITGGLLGDHVNVYHKNVEAGVFAFHRWRHGGAYDDTIVVANFSRKGYERYQLGLPRLGRWHMRFNSDWTEYCADYDGYPSEDVEATSEPVDDLPASGVVPIGPYTLIILSQGPE